MVTANTKILSCKTKQNSNLLFLRKVLVMSKEVFLVSDTHFSHKAMTIFTDADGKKVRPFESIEEMDETLVQNWNKVVRQHDKVYHLGDVVINRKALSIMDRLNGSKVLIKGNHDIFKIEEYLKYFRDVRAYHVFDKFIMSHIPVHTSQLERFKANIHGHLHTNIVLDNEGNADPRYLSVCVEKISYTPVNISEINIRI